ncbi:hypothetical protein ACUXZZ_45100 (plasmid) [Streptomyces graminifolii]|uniref:hypothetical protein n=1 Tax=Streptomyces graminifolii TaxID=1266771 RepID=UPI0040580349
MNTCDNRPAFPVCQCCPRRLISIEAKHGRTVCRLCEERLAKQLDEILTLWQQLHQVVVPGTAPADGGGDEPRAPGPTGSRPPADVNVLSLLGGGVTQPLLVEEDAWRQELRKERHYPLTPFRGNQTQTLTGCVTWLRGNLLWACHSYPDLDDLSRTLGKLLGEMRGAITGDRRPKEDLTPGCPMAARGHVEDDTNAPPCGGLLTFDPRRTVIRCDTCRRTYGVADWHHLGAAAGLFTLPSLTTAA